MESSVEREFWDDNTELYRLTESAYCSHVFDFSRFEYENKWLPWNDGHANDDLDRSDKDTTDFAQNSINCRETAVKNRFFFTLLTIFVETFFFCIFFIFFSFVT